jgi:hypothetical protein
MNTFTYDFDELQPWPGLAVYCYGSAEISYGWEGPDREVGYRGGPYDIEVESITLDAPLDRAHPLYALIVAQLETSDHVAEKCVEDYEEE